MRQGEGNLLTRVIYSFFIAKLNCFYPYCSLYWYSVGPYSPSAPAADMYSNYHMMGKII